MDLTRQEFLRTSLGLAGALVFGAPQFGATARADEKGLIKLPFSYTHTGSIKMMTDTVRRHRID